MTVWIRWSSIRHQDGRRTSGVGYNISKPHIVLPGPFDATLCGRTPYFHTKRKTSEEIPPDACRACVRLAGIRTRP
jgi:hypothetical protein